MHMYPPKIHPILENKNNAGMVHNKSMRSRHVWFGVHWSQSLLATLISQNLATLIRFVLRLVLYHFFKRFHSQCSLVRFLCQTNSGGF